MSDQVRDLSYLPEEARNSILEREAHTTRTHELYLAATVSKEALADRNSPESIALDAMFSREAKKQSITIPAIDIYDWYYETTPGQMKFETLHGHPSPLTFDQPMPLSGTTDPIELDSAETNFNVRELSPLSLDKLMQFAGAEHKFNAYGIPRLSLNKPLPPLPPLSSSIVPPYYDYMFANAHLEKATEPSPRPNILASGNAISQESHGSMTLEDLIYDDVPSPEAEEPRTPQYVFHSHSSYNSINANSTAAAQTQVVIPTKNQVLVGNFTDFQAADFVVDPNYETKKADATAGFYGGYVVEKLLSPCHATNFDDGTGFGHVQDGAEAFPEQWKNPELSLPNYPFTPAPVKRILMPKSQKAKAAKNDIRYPEYPESDRISQAPSVDTRLIVKKRAAGDLFGNIAMLDAGGYDDEEVQYLYTKRVRLSLDAAAMDEEIQYDPMPSPCFISSSEGGHVRSSLFSITTAEVLSKRENFSDTENGFPGQFVALELPERGFHPRFLAYTTMKDKQTFVMGNPLHPNNLFVHNKFRRCSNEYNLDYDKVSAHPCSEVGQTFELANKLSLLAAQEPRTELEDNLRREAHLECTMARLEGVVVGQYRYYQGHSNIEEYNEGGMCICWDACICAKLCTLFADMICPCAEHIDVCDA